MASTLTSATGNSRFPRDAGVSLVEALTALMIVGLMVGAVMLLAPGPDNRTRVEAERLAARIVLASEESVIANRPLSLVVNEEGYGFERLEDNGWFPAEANSPLGFRAWPPDMDVRVDQDDGAGADGRVARFDALGGATPVAVIISGFGARWRVAINAQGGVDVARAE
jgi:type II secretion system protein H